MTPPKIVGPNNPKLCIVYKYVNLNLPGTSQAGYCLRCCFGSEDDIDKLLHNRSHQKPSYTRNSCSKEACALEAYQTRNLYAKKPLQQRVFAPQAFQTRDLYASGNSCSKKSITQETFYARNLSHQKPFIYT